MAVVQAHDKLSAVRLWTNNNNTYKNNNNNIMFDWFGFRSRSKKPSRVLFLGLDNAGKTTTVQYLSSSTISQVAPTQIPTQITAKIGKCTVNITDLGGHGHARSMWKDYLLRVDGVVFFISSTERDRFLEAKQQLDGLLSDEGIANVPILILGTKIDRPDACSEVELRQVLDVQTTGKTLNKGKSPLNVRPIEIFMTSVLDGGTGVKEAFEWFTQAIQQK